MKSLVLVVCLLAVMVAAPGGARAESRPTGHALWPLQPQPEVVRRFDPPTSPWGAGHRGVDLLGAPGQPVHAALAGTVAFAGTLAGRGVVVVDHGGLRTTYEPVSPSVPVGTAVAAGGELGGLQTGLSHCLPRTCLHWGLLRGEEYLDPLSLLGFAPIRLLPLAGPLWFGSGAVSPVVPTGSLPGSALLRPWGEPAGTPFADALR
jgi:murein DD-endopeptidase MepM/ murein hydrolase activator NlpD